MTRIKTMVTAYGREVNDARKFSGEKNLTSMLPDLPVLATVQGGREPCDEVIRGVIHDSAER